ncbi:DUF494 family protein [Escherichia coli]
MRDKLTRDLTDAGFEREDIFNALIWLEKLADYQEGLENRCSLRLTLSPCVFPEEESQRLDASCRGILLFLEQIQVLYLETRKVIERVMALDTAEFELEELKWVILMVLFNFRAAKTPINKWKNYSSRRMKVCCINSFCGIKSCYGQICTVFGV